MELSSRVLIVGHWSAAFPAAAAARAFWYGVEIDVLPYGRSGDSMFAPPGTRTIRAPRPGSSLLSSAIAAFRWLVWLRRQQYDLVAVGQPNLVVSRARGLLLAFPHLLGPRRVVVLDSEGAVIRGEVPLAQAVGDLLRWIALQTIALLLTRLAATALNAVARSATKTPAALDRNGSVVYLRTDIDLALNPLSSGGSVAHTVGVVNALAQRGHEVEFWSTGDVVDLPAGAVSRRLPVFLRGNVPVEAAELLSGFWQALLPSRPRATAFLYQRYSLNNLAGVLLAGTWRVPLVLEANGSEAKWRSDWATVQFPALARATERAILRRADRIVAVSENAARDLLASGAPADRLRVVPNGVEFERFAQAAPVALPFPDGSFVVTFVGLFYPWHGVRFLAEAFVRLRARAPHAKLVLVGDGEQAPLVRAVLDRAGCDAAVHLPGMVRRQEVPGYLAASDVVVSPHAQVRDFIGSPIKLFEYMASGRAIVASRVGQIGEILRDGENALLVEPERPDALADALATLCDDEALRLRLGAGAQDEARRLHSWEARVEAMLAPDT